MRISDWSSAVCSSDRIAQEDSRLAQIRRAIGWMRGHYGEMLRIETLAEIAGMSEASFHRHFKAATAMSPRQSQKSLRLPAARRLLATGSAANRPAFRSEERRVGNEGGSTG